MSQEPKTIEGKQANWGKKIKNQDELNSRLDTVKGRICLLEDEYEEIQNVTQKYKEIKM